MPISYHSDVRRRGNGPRAERDCLEGKRRTRVASQSRAAGRLEVGLGSDISKVVSCLVDELIANVAAKERDSVAVLFRWSDESV